MDKQTGQTASVEELYIKEKKKANIFMISTIVLAVLFVGAIFIPIGDSSEQTPTSSASTQPPERGMMGGGNREPLTDLYNSDGSLNTSAVDEMVSNIPTDVKVDFLARYPDRIVRSVEQGEITQAQADALIDYLSLDAEEL